MSSDSRSDRSIEISADSAPDPPSTAQPAESWVEWLGSAMLLLAPFAFFAALMLLDGWVR
jgi:hypothetical protein